MVLTGLPEVILVCRLHRNIGPQSHLALPACSLLFFPHPSIFPSFLLLSSHPFFLPPFHPPSFPLFLPFLPPFLSPFFPSFLLPSFRPLFLPSFFPPFLPPFLPSILPKHWLCTSCTEGIVPGPGDTQVKGDYCLET